MRRATRFVLPLMFVYWFLLRNTVNSQACKSLAADESTHRIKDHSLVGHVILNTTAATKGLCFFKCTRECRCTSFNCQPNGHNTCELNDEDNSTHPEAVQPRQGFNFYNIYLVGNIGLHQSVNCWKWCCESDPCLNGGTCDITCGAVRRLQCHCPQGFSGKLCEMKISPNQSTAKALPSRAVKPFLNETVKVLISQTAKVLPSLTDNILSSRLSRQTISPSPSQTVEPLLNQTVRSLLSQTVEPLLTEKVTPSPSQIVELLLSQLITPSPSQTVEPLLSQIVAPSPSQTVGSLQSKTATPSPTKTVSVSSSKINFFPHTCSELKKGNPNAKDGEYKIYNINNDPFKTHCQFDDEGFAWTLVMSYILENNRFYKEIPLSKSSRRTGRYSDFRLSFRQMKHIQKLSTRWRWTCNFQTGISKKDYAEAAFKKLDPLTFTGGSVCKRFIYINVRGKECKECTVRIGQDSGAMLHVQSYKKQCSFHNVKGARVGEQNFGKYKVRNKKFSCLSSMNSTTDMWFGGKY